LSAALRNSIEHRPKADVRPWASDEANAIYSQFVKDVDERTDKEPRIENFIGRYSENAVRLATIRAAGRAAGQRERTYDFVVDEHDMQWGIDVVRVCGERLIEQAGIFMVEDELRHGEAVAKIIRLLKESKGGMKHSELLRAVQHQVKAKDFAGIIGQLLASETIVMETRTSNKGRSYPYYMLKGRG
jgi:hypothetical protein